MACITRTFRWRERRHLAERDDYTFRGANDDYASNKNLAHHSRGLALDQMLGAGVGEIAQLPRLQAKLLQARGLKTVRGDDVDRRFVADFVGLAVGYAAADAAPGHP